MISSLIGIKKQIENNKLDAVLISSVSNIISLTGYPGLTTDEREAFLLILKDSQYFITDSRSSGTVKKIVKDFELAEIAAYSPLQSVFKKLIDKHKIKTLGIEEENLTVSEFKSLRKLFKTINFETKNLRTIKSSEEIEKIGKACKLGDKAFDYILKKIKRDVSEKELACEIELFLKKNGANTSFSTIVAFGKNSAIPHHVPTVKKLTDNQIVLFDLGAKLNGYCSDMTRTVFFGKPNSKQKHVYETVLNAQQKAIDYLRRSIKNRQSINSSNVDKIARKYITSQGYPTIPHSLGHGVGIQIHESPRLSPKSKDVLKEGMVFSVEPGIYIPNFGGVRIEDLVVLEKSGPHILTHSPKTLIEI
jgi:Xaa-Pro aminopeptidase